MLKNKFKGNPSVQEALNAPRWCNITFLISEYFKNIHLEDSDGSQDFYLPKDGHYLRNYRYFDMLYSTKVKNKTEKKYFTIEQMKEKSEDKIIPGQYLQGVGAKKEEKEKRFLKKSLNE